MVLVYKDQTLKFKIFNVKDQFSKTKKPDTIIMDQ